MELFQGGFSSAMPNGVLSHFGSMTAAVQRIDSMHALQQLGKMRQGNVMPLAVSGKGNPAALEAFASFVQGTEIAKYTLNIQNPLRLTDCWGDDPIGSGALEIFQDNADLTDTDARQLIQIFHPFQQAIYPEHVDALLSKNAVKDIRNKREKDWIFREQLQKRKQRSQAIGEPWHVAEPQELVWMDLTLKLRDWAMRNKYDAFVYRNDCEGGGDDCYVTLGQKNIVERVEEFTFNKDLFLEKTLPVLDDFVSRRSQKSGGARGVEEDLYWVGQEPVQFWTKKAEPV